MTDITYGHTSRGFEVTFEGRTTIMGQPGSIEQMREGIAYRQVRMEEEARRLRMMTALADVMEAERDQAVERARTERNAKAARTRTHNRDPFGFDAMARRNETQVLGGES